MRASLLETTWFVPDAARGVRLLIVLLLATASARAQTTFALSATSAAATGNGASNLVALSGDARWAVFQSAASDLVAQDVNAHDDVFLRDLWSQSLTRVSVATDGGAGNDDSRQPQVSEDGCWVVFQSFATNLVAGDTNDASDIFVRDVLLGRTSRVSVSSSGAQAASGSRYPCLSRDGRTIVFESSASNLVPGDGNDRKDIFVHDRIAGTTVRASRAFHGGSANNDSMSPALSSDGRHAAFSSYASDLVSGDTNGVMDVFVHDLALGTTRLVSCTSDGSPANGASAQPSLSASGTYAAFHSVATNLVAGDTNGFGDVLVKDLSTGVVVRASVATSGAQADWHAYASRITPDGRYVAFYSEASTLEAGDTNGVSDVFVRDLAQGLTTRASLTVFGQPSTGPAQYPVISDDGRWIAFESVAANLVLGDGNAASDVFVHDRLGSFHPHCAEDGSHSLPCPCANFGGPGRGCENSTGSGGARLEASGSTFADQVKLAASGMSGGVALFVQADAALGAQLPFGDGVRCIAGQLLRLYSVQIEAGSASAPGAFDPSIRVRSAELGDAFTTGVARHYAVVYRDPDPSFCTSSTSNVSNALRIDW